MAFAQLTHRESSRDIESCVNAQPNNRYHLGFPACLSRNALANPYQVRVRRIHAVAEFAI